MAHNIRNIAYRGSRQDVWHHLGTEHMDGQSIEAWRLAAGLDWQVELAPAFVAFNGQQQKVDDYRFVQRSDNGAVLGCVSPTYKPVQPREVLDWFTQYIDTDSRFKLDAAGELGNGETVWATAAFEEMDVAGDKHVPRLLMTTTFDGTGATLNSAVMTRVICNNTLRAALGEKDKAVIRTRHSTTFDAKRTSRELDVVASGFKKYKAMGDAMATVRMEKETIAKFFKAMLDIPFDATSEETSTRKLNQFNDLRRCYATTAGETDSGTAWCALNAVTRYVDHERSTRGGTNQDKARFASAQFGSGAAMKEKAVALLYEMHDGDLLRAASRNNDVSDMLRQPLKFSQFA